MTDAALAIVCSSIVGTITGLPGLVTAWRMWHVPTQVGKVKEIVDGPLSVALKSNAEITAKLAQHTGAHEDVIAAAKAAILSENREAGKQEAAQKQ